MHLNQHSFSILVCGMYLHSAATSFDTCVQSIAIQFNSSQINSTFYKCKHVQVLLMEISTFYLLLRL